MLLLGSLFLYRAEYIFCTEEQAPDSREGGTEGCAGVVPPILLVNILHICLYFIVTLVLCLHLFLNTLPRSAENERNLLISITVSRNHHLVSTSRSYVARPAHRTMIVGCKTSASMLKGR